VEVKVKIFPCLNCGVDTGCPNKLICDECRAQQKQKAALVRSRKVAKKRAAFG